MIHYSQKQKEIFDNYYKNNPKKEINAEYVRMLKAAIKNIKQPEEDFSQAPSYIHSFIQGESIDNVTNVRYANKLKDFVGKEEKIENDPIQKAFLITLNDLNYINDKMIERTGSLDIAIHTQYALDLTISQLKKLNELENKLAKLGKRVYFEEYRSKFSIDSVINANLQIDNWVNAIERGKYQDKELSNLEKYLCAYDIVTNFGKYNLEPDNANDLLSRSLSFVLNPDDNRYICCVGYANMLSAICYRMGIPCEVLHERYCSARELNECDKSNHSTCRVYIEDDKYDIKGIYHSDPCGDAVSDTFASTLNYSLNTLDHFFTHESDIRRFTPLEIALNSYTVSEVTARAISDDNSFTDFLYATKIYPDLDELNNKIPPYPIKRAQFAIRQLIADNAAKQYGYESEQSYLSDYILRSFNNYNNKTLLELLKFDDLLEIVLENKQLEVAAGNEIVAKYSNLSHSPISPKIIQEAFITGQAALYGTTTYTKNHCMQSLSDTTVPAMLKTVRKMVDAELNGSPIINFYAPGLMQEINDFGEKECVKYDPEDPTSVKAFTNEIHKYIDFLVNNYSGKTFKFELLSPEEAQKLQPWVSEFLESNGTTFKSVSDYKRTTARQINSIIKNKMISEM